MVVFFCRHVCLFGSVLLIEISSGRQLTDQVTNPAKVIIGLLVIVSYVKWSIFSNLSNLSVQFITISFH